MNTEFDYIHSCAMKKALLSYHTNCLANDTRGSRQGKGDESNDSKGENASGKSTSPTPAREATRRSERLNRTPATSSVNQKPEAKQTDPSPLRRSARVKKHSLSSSSQSKKSERSESPSSSNKQKKKEKSVRQLTLETKEIDTNEKRLPRKRMDARTSMSFFKPNVKKADVAVEMTDKFSHYFGSKNGDVGNDCSQVEVVKSRQEDGGRIEEKKLNEPNASDGKPPKQGDCVEEPGVAIRHCTPMPSIKISGQSDEISGRERGNLLPELFSVDNKTSGDNDLKSWFKVTSSKRKRPTGDMNSATSEMLPDKNNFDADAICSYGCMQDCLEEKCATCFKRPRVAHDSEQQDICCCSTKLNHDLCGTSLSKDRGETGDTDTRGFTEYCITDLQRKESSVDFHFDGNLDICAVCKLGENLLCCDGRGCKRCYHLSCLDPPLKDVPPGIWHCPTCVMKKLESGVYLVSKGIESIWDVREVELTNDNGIESIWDVREVELTNDNGLGRQRQFLVKYKGLAHAHNNWVPESQLLLEAPTLLASFNPDNQDSRWKPEWAVPHHFLQKRLLTPSKHYGGHLGENLDSLLDCQYEWLVKWCCLGYEHATWELDAASFMSSPEAVSLKTDYENRHEKGNTTKCLQAVNKKAETTKDSVVKLSAGVSSGFDNSYLDFVNNLLDCWQKKQNAVVIDDQERIVKVISFISSLSSRSSWPFLVLTTSSALNLWDEELFHLAPSIYSVTYCGSKDLRKAIRTLEFYDEAGCIMFQLLVTLPEVVIEDVSVFESINWEAIIVDECQDVRIYSYFEQMKSLSTGMRLLLVNGHLEDVIIEKLLSLVDFQSGLTGSQGSVTNSSRNIGHLKERLSRYICKFDSSRFIEYWVPAQMSNMQREQYCATLLSNSLSLCSSSKNDPVGALRDVLISARKCCNHPYSVDSCLQGSLIEDGKVKVIDVIDAGVKASGKLQLLDALLSEIRKKGLRVLVLFQSSSGSGRDNIGDILDDIVRDRFGQDSYERVEGGVLRSRKQAAVNNFNNQSGMFVFLLETRSCASSIKLSSVDTVIIFDSDWNPVNDLRNLQKITLDSPSEKIKVFRLYSSYTVEEKVLILAKHDKILDSKLQSVSPSTSHMLLMWGATYLFSKLSEFHSSSRPVCIESMLKQGFLKDVIQEFMMILPQNCNDNVASNSKIIKATQRQGSYINNYLLHGELESQLINEEPPHVFWKKLLEGKQPQWKYLSGSSQRNRKRVHRFDESSNKLEVEDDEAAKKQKKVTNNSTNPPHLVSSLAGNFGASIHNTSQSMPKTAEHTPTSPCLVGPCTRTDLHDSQNSLHHLLKPEIAKLCEILQLPEDVKDMVERFLEYVMNNHRVVQEPATILQAFQISLCWTAASLLKHKLDHTKSLALAKQHLHFDCKKEEADFVYSMLRCLKKIFLCHIGSFKLIGSPPSSQLLVPDHSENHLHATSLKTTLGYVFTDDEVLSNLGLAQKDFCKSIKDIEKKCDKQLKRLLQRQQEEKEDFERKYAKEKALLERKQKTEAAVIRLHSNSSMRTDKLKLLDIEYAKKFEELKFETEAHRKDLMEMQLLARNKLKEREARWVEGVKSWATVELVNKPPPIETGHNHKSTASVDSCFEDKVPQRAQSMQDGEVPLEIPGTLRSDEDEQVLPAVQTVFGHAPDGVSSTKLHGEVPLTVPKDAGLDDSLINYIPAHTHSLKERAPIVEATLGTPEAISCSDMDTILNPLSEGSFVDGAVRQVPHREELPLGTPEIVSSSVMENVASTDPPSTRVTSYMHDEVLLEISKSAPYEAMDGSTIRQTDRNAMTSQQNGGEEILSEQVEVCSAGLLQKEVQVCRNAAKQVCESSDKTNIAYQQDGEFPSINFDTSPAVLVVGSETGRCQDREVLADKAADNEDSQSSGKMARVNVQDGIVCIVDKDPLSDKMAVINCQNGESLSGVAVALSEQVEGCNAGLQQREEIRVGKNAASEDYDLSDKTNIANQQDGEHPSIDTETAPGGVLVGSKTSKGQDGEVLADKAADSEGSQSSSKTARVNLQDGIVCLATKDSHSDKMDVLNQQKSEALSGVAVTPGEQVEGCNAGLQQDEEVQAGKNAANQDHESSDRTNIANQQDGEVPAINRDAGSKTGNYQDGEMLADRVADNEDRQFCRVTLQDVEYLQEVFQAECSVPTSSTAMEDGVPQDHQMQQVEVSPDLAHNVVSAQSNGAPVMEHVLPAETSLDGSVTPVSGTGTMPTTSASGTHPAHTTPLTQMPLPSFQDPLQYELERVRKEADNTTTSEDYDLSDKTNIANQQDGEHPSIDTETAPGGVLVGCKTSKGQDGEVLADKAADSEGSQSSSITARVNLQDGIVCLATKDSHSDKMDVLNQQKSEALSGVAVTPCEQVEGCNAGLQQDEEVQAGKNAANQDHESSDRTNIANQQGGEVPAINRDAGSKTGNYQDGEMLADRVADNEDRQFCRVTLQDIEYLQEVFQAECSVPTSSTAMEDGVPQDHQMQQVEVSPDLAHNVVSAQSNGAPVMEHVLPAETSLDGSVTPVSGTGTMPTTSASGTHPAHTTPLTQMPLPSFQDPLQYELERVRKEADNTTTTHENMKLQMRLDCEKEIEEAIGQIRRKYEIKVQELEAGFFAKKKELDANHNKVLMNKILADAFRSKCMDFRGSATPGKQQESISSFTQQLLHLSAQPTAQRPSIVAGVSSPGTAGTLQSTTTPCPPAAGLRGTSPRPPAQPTTQRPSIVAARASSPGPSGFFQTTAAPTPPPARPHGTSPHLLVQPTTQRPSIVAAGMSPSGPPSSLQTTAAGPRGTPPPPQAVHHSRSLFSGTPARPPHISSISPAANNLQAGSEIRAPAPHLQPFRSPVSMPAPGLSSLSRGLPSSQVPSNPTTTSPSLPSGVSSLSRGSLGVQVHGNPSTVSPVLLSGVALSPGLSRPQVPANPSTTSPMLSQHQSKLAPSILMPSDLQNRAHLHESVGLSRPQPVPAVELPMGIEDQRRTNPTQVSSLPLQTDLGSNSQPSAVADDTQPNGTRTNKGSPNEVVCLSDDD